MRGFERPNIADRQLAAGALVGLIGEALLCVEVVGEQAGPIIAQTCARHAAACEELIEGLVDV